MKKSTIILVLVVIPNICAAQDSWKDNIMREWFENTSEGINEFVN
jgi:hypothetical protein